MAAASLTAIAWQSPPWVTRKLVQPSQVWATMPRCVPPGRKGVACAHMQAACTLQKLHVEPSSLNTVLWSSDGRWSNRNSRIDHLALPGKDRNPFHCSWPTEPTMRPQTDGPGCAEHLREHAEGSGRAATRSAARRNDTHGLSEPFVRADRGSRPQTQ
eukprot:scaffold2134_cov384-Prasinococcus_capsulatus_cf.AAC.8